MSEKVNNNSLFTFTIFFEKNDENHVYNAIPTITKYYQTAVKYHFNSSDVLPIYIYKSDDPCEIDHSTMIGYKFKFINIVCSGDIQMIIHKHVISHEIDFFNSLACKIHIQPW